MACQSRLSAMLSASSWCLCDYIGQPR
jgi:hypothetical protein